MVATLGADGDRQDRTGGHAVTSWRKRNRIGLLLLPAALILAVAGSSSRIDDYYWTQGLHQPERADAKGVVDFVDTYDDGFKSYPIRTRISLVSVEKADSIPSSFDGADKPVTIPTGAALWHVRLHFDTDPSIVMSGCHVAIMDKAGNRFEQSASQFQSEGSTPIYLCAPDDTPGPQVKVGSTSKPALEPGDKPRPQTYGTDCYITTPDSTVPTSVRVWFFQPKYAELPISPR